MKPYCTYFWILIFSVLTAQEETVSKIYWNSLSTAVNVGVPLADDESLRGGRIQIRVSFDDGENFLDIADPFEIEKRDIDDLKEVSISAEIFESMPGFQENGEAQFIAEIWDKAGNSIVGSVSDSILTIDETVPTLVSLKVISSNAFDSSLAMPNDSITFDLITSEPIKQPVFEINNDDFEPVGFEKSWKTVYYADDADDGIISFIIQYFDLAGNPSQPITMASNNKSITKDGTLPELDEVKLFTSNVYDSTLAVESDSVFLQFTATEPIQNIDVKLDSVESNQLKLDSLTYTFFHVFTSSDSEGIIPISVDFMDMAGNAGEHIDETTDDSEVLYDRTPPATFKVENVGSLQGEIEIINTSESDSTAINADTQSAMGSIQELYIIIFAGVFGVLLILIWAAWFKIFSKAGQRGWKALVPFFNLFILSKILNKPIWWLLIYLMLPISWFLVALQTAKLFGKKTLYAIGLMFLPFVFYPMLAFGKSRIEDNQPDQKPKKVKKSEKKKTK